MPINSIILEQFQAHKDTTLEFDDGMNVIWGESDHGKSSIIRSIRWVVLNRPQGDEFKRHETKKTQVTLETDNFIVQRRRTSSKNEYEMDEEVFKALRSDVPEDISTALNLSQANIQSQHEVYFLVDKSPGQRSKILNAVAGLQIMDKVLKKTNSDIRSTGSSIKSLTEIVNDTDDKINELSWLSSADKFLSKLELYEKDIEEKEEHFKKVCFIIYQIKELENIKSEFLSDKCVDEINNLCKKEEDIKELEKEYYHLYGIIDAIRHFENKLEAITIIDTTELEKLHDKIEFLESKYKRIQDIIEEIKFKEAQHEQLSSQLKETEKNISTELKRLGKCPTCGGST